MTLLNDLVRDIITMVGLVVTVLGFYYTIVQIRKTKSAAIAAGFVYHQEFDAFIDGPVGKLKAGIHLLYAGELLRPEDMYPNPALTESERAAEFQVINLVALLRMKLVSWRDKDRMHLIDIIGVGLIDKTWPARLPPLLAERLQQLLDNPNG